MAGYNNPGYYRENGSRVLAQGLLLRDNRLQQLQHLYNKCRARQPEADHRSSEPDNWGV